MDDVNSIIDRMKEATNSRRYEDLANFLGVKLSTINNWKKRGFVPEKNILKCVLLTNKTKEWLLGEDTESGASIINEDGITYNRSLSNNIDIPLVKLQAGAGEGVYNFLPQQTIISLDPGTFPFVSQGNATAVEIIGDSMEPELRNGDYIIITPQEPDRITEDGIYAIRIEGMLKVKSLLFRLDGTIDIISNNQRYQSENYDPKTSQVDFQILGRKRLHISR